MFIRKKTLDKIKDSERKEGFVAGYQIGIYRGFDIGTQYHNMGRKGIIISPSVKQEIDSICKEKGW